MPTKHVSFAYKVDNAYRARVVVETFSEVFFCFPVSLFCFCWPRQATRVGLGRWVGVRTRNRMLHRRASCTPFRVKHLNRMKLLSFPSPFAHTDSCDRYYNRKTILYVAGSSVFKGEDEG